MLPLITAALGLLQQNKQDQAARKQAMTAATMGQFAEAPAPGSGNKLGAVVDAIGSMASPSAAPQAPGAVGPNGGQPLSPMANADLDSALGTLDERKGLRDDDNMLPMRGNRY